MIRSQHQPARFLSAIAFMCGTASRAAAAESADAVLEAEAEAGTASDEDAEASIYEPWDTPPPRAGLAALNRPTGIAEFGFGWLTLPGARICVARIQNDCEFGDTSFMLEAWQLFRANTKLAFGAGLTLGLLTTTDAPRRDPEGIERDHSRGYFLFEGTARYYPYVGTNVELWTGLTGGLAVVSDRFTSKSEFADKVLVGPQGVTIRTEGYSVGLTTGVTVSLAERWTFGGQLRYSIWLLPDTPATDPFLDEASLTGTNQVLTASVGLAYRIPL